jgi:hypothetical protein
VASAGKRQNAHPSNEHAARALRAAERSEKQCNARRARRSRPSEIVRFSL